MSFQKTTDSLVNLLEEILEDIPKVRKGNKTAAQRIRTKTLHLSKLSKDWRRLSIDSNKKKLSKVRKKSA